MLLAMKMAILQRRVGQTRMAVDLGWDPARLSRIIHETRVPTVDERRAIARYLGVRESQVFPANIGGGRRSGRGPKSGEAAPSARRYRPGVGEE
jgi:transcriptional regulator with XRE-family HTH domain